MISLAEVKQTLHRYTARPIRAVDGDTIVATLVLGVNVELAEEHVRLFGVNTPELVGADAVRGKAAKVFTTLWIDQALKLYLLSNEFKPREKYGRILATVFRDDDPISLNDALVAAGLAAPMAT